MPLPESIQPSPEGRSATRHNVASLSLYTPETDVSKREWIRRNAAGEYPV
jgi:hypothetical protein